MIYALWHGVEYWTKDEAHKWKWYSGVKGDLTFTDLNEAYTTSQKKKKDYPNCVYEVREYGQ